MGCLSSTPEAGKSGGGGGEGKAMPTNPSSVDKPHGDGQSKSPEGAPDGGGGEDAVATDAVVPEFKAEAASGAPAGKADESYSFWERNKTTKNAPAPVKGDKQQKLHNTIKATMKATLGGGDLRQTVKLPEKEDLNEWIAVNTVHFYNAANMIYGTCAEFCTAQSCPNMTAGRNEYLWKDGNQYKKATKVPAPVYIDLLLNWVNEQISNPKLFPVDENATFPSDFKKQVKDIYKRLFRLYAHIYYSHFDKICAIGAKAHLNTCFKHFIFFILEFQLVEEKDLAPLKNFIDKFKDAKDA